MAKPTPNSFKAYPEDPDVTILYITRMKCPDEGDERGGKIVAFQIDTSDTQLASKHTWSAHWSNSTKSFYAQTHVKNNGSRAILHLHRLLVNATDSGVQVDHISGDTTDNRRGNLRFATHSENQRNRGAQCNNTSGYKGVSWHKRIDKWQSRIRHQGKLIHLGFYPTPKLAAAAYNAKAKELFGEFAVLNVIQGTPHKE